MPTPNLNAPDIAQSQAAAVTANEANAIFDAFLSSGVINSTTNSPPGSPTNFDFYRIGSSGSGDWSGFSLGFALYLNGAWKKTTAKEGMSYWDKATDKRFRFDGSAWREVALQRVLSKMISITNPSTSEFIALMQLANAITIRRIVAAVAGTTPSRTFTLRHGSDISATGTEVVTGGSAISNTTTGTIITTFNAASVAANSWLWLRTTAGSGTVTRLDVHIEYTED